MAAPDIQHGKEFERMVNEAMKDLYKSYPFRWERTLDTGAAGSLVRKADSDYRAMWKSGLPGCPYLVYIECKASVLGKPFASNFRSLVKGTQNASLQMARRAGAQACVLYYDIQNKGIEVWRGKDINDTYPIPRMRILNGPAYRFPDEKLSAWADWFAGDPGSFMWNLSNSTETVNLFQG